MNSTSKTTKSIALAAGLATVAAVSLYFILKSKKKTASKKPLTEQEKDDIIRQIKLTYKGKFISVDSILDIYAASQKISYAECENLLTEYKKVRRNIYKDNLALYVKSCEDFINNSDQVKVKAQQKVLDGLGISQHTFIEAMNYYYSQGEPKIVDFQNTLIKAEAHEIKTEILPMDKFRTVLIRITELYEAERLNISNIKRLLNNPQYVPEVITSRVADIIYKELGVEHEDFNRTFSVRYELLAFQKPELVERYTNTKKKNASKKPLTEQEKNDIIRQIKLTFNGKYLSVDSIIDIYAATNKISDVECDNLYAAYKKIRRSSYKNNLALYVKSCEDFVNNSDQAKAKVQQKVLDGLGISQYTFIETMNYYYLQGEPRIADLPSTLLKAESHEIKTEILPLDKFRTILIRITELYEAECVNIPNVKRLLNNKQYVPEVITSRVSDIIYKEFGVEHEDFNKAFSVHDEIIADQKPELIEKYTNATNKLFGTI